MSLINWSSEGVKSFIKADVLEVCWFGAFRCLLIWLTMPKRKDISNDLTEAIVAINLRRGHFQTILSPLFYSNEDNSQVENIQDNCQSSQEWTSQQIYPKVRLCTVQRNCRKPNNYTSVNMLNVKVHGSAKVWHVWKGCQKKASSL